MLNLKIIVLLIGVFLMTMGFVNNQKTDKSKYVYKVLPRNVYDEIFLSMPSLEYKKKCTCPACDNKFDIELRGLQDFFI